MDIPNSNEIRVIDEDFRNNLTKYEFYKFKPEIKKRNELYLDNSQIMLKNYLSNTTIYENILLYHELGTGKCHAKDTNIIMWNGEYKKVQDIKQGELIMGDDSTPRQVLKLARGRQKLYEIKSLVNNKDKYIVNEEHILCLIARYLPYIDYDKNTDEYKIIYVKDNDIKKEKCSLDECKEIYERYKNEKIIEKSVKEYIKLEEWKKMLLEGYKIRINLRNINYELDSNGYIIGYLWMKNEIQIENVVNIIKDINRLEFRTSIIKGFIHDLIKIEKIDMINELNKRINGIEKEYQEIVKNLLNLVGYIVVENEIIDYIEENEIYSYSFDIKEIEEGDYYGFVIDGNQRYMIENLTITHNTCTSITIAEGFKEYINNMGNKIVVLVKNKNIQMNFINEMYSKCTGEEYIADDKREDKYEKSKVLRKINKKYQFITYGTFVNSVLGIKEYIQKNGKNVLKKINGIVQRKMTNNMITDLNNSVIIIDEVHNITNNDIYLALIKVLKNSYNYRLVLLTATPIYDNVKEIFEIVNIMNIKEEYKELPIRNMLTNNYIEQINNASKVLRGGVYKVSEQGIQEIEKRIYGKVSYIKQNTESYPSIIDNGEQIRDEIGSIKVIKCEMSDYQYMLYITTVIRDVKHFKDYDISTIGNLETFEKNVSSSLYKNTSDSSTIVYPHNKLGKDGYNMIIEKGGKHVKKEYKNVLTTDLAKYSTKLKKILENIKDTKGLIFIYSNYVSNGGTSLIRLMLLENGYTEYTGKRNEKSKGNIIMYDDSTSVERRENLRKIFNSEENKNGELIKIIIGSPIISEGITLKNIRQVHILEPSWNLSKINQIIGRAIRKNSHQTLEKDMRNVEIYKYAAVYDIRKITNDIENHKLKDLFTFFIDIEKYLLSELKDRENKKVERLLKENSFNCYYNQVLNKVNSKYNNTELCDYMNCEIKCKITTNESNIDLSTYAMNINTNDVYDVKFVENLILELFKTHFIWSLHTIKEYVRKIDKSISMHVLTYVLNNMKDNKKIITDMFDRDGYIIKRLDMYIFNPVDKPIEMSYYDKYLNFDKPENKYTLNEFLEKENTNIKVKEKEKKTYIIDETIDDEIIKYNQYLIDNNLILGSFRSAGTKENLYGIKTDVFRIIDLRKQKNETEDARKRIRGMNILSYKKPELIEMLNFLNVEAKYTFDEYDKKALSEILKDYLINNNLVLS